MKEAIRYASGLLAIALVVAAVYFIIRGSWMAAAFLLLFGGLEFAVWSSGRFKEKRD